MEGRAKMKLLNFLITTAVSRSPNWSTFVFTEGIALMRGGCLSSFFRDLEIYKSHLLLAELGSQVSCTGCVAESLPYWECREELLTYLRSWTAVATRFWFAWSRMLDYMTSRSLPKWIYDPKILPRHHQTGKVEGPSWKMDMFAGQASGLSSDLSREKVLLRVRCPAWFSVSSFLM